MRTRSGSASEQGDVLPRRDVAAAHEEHSLGRRAGQHVQVECLVCLCAVGRHVRMRRAKLEVLIEPKLLERNDFGETQCRP